MLKRESNEIGSAWWKIPFHSTYEKPEFLVEWNAPVVIVWPGLKTETVFLSAPTGSGFRGVVQSKER